MFMAEDTEAREDAITWEQFFMGVARLSAQRSKDPNTQVGACIVDKKHRILGTGYNGVPRGIANDAIPWARHGADLLTKYPYVCHAEANAILNSTRELDGCRIYTTVLPCCECAKLIIQSGIKEVVYEVDKHPKVTSFIAARKIFRMAGTAVQKYEDMIGGKE